MLALLVLLIVFTVVELVAALFLIATGMLYDKPYAFVIGLVFLLFAAYFASIIGKATCGMQRDRIRQREQEKRDREYEERWGAWTYEEARERIKREVQEEWGAGKGQP